MYPFLRRSHKTGEPQKRWEGKADSYPAGTENSPLMKQEEGKGLLREKKNWQKYLKNVFYLGISSKYTEKSKEKQSK